MMVLPARIATKLVVQEISARDYTYCRETKRIRLYRNGKHMVPITKSATMFEATARSILGQCGLTQEQIEACIKKAGD